MNSRPWLAGKSLQLNPKFGLTRPRVGPEIACCAALPHELGAEFAADLPDQPALLGTAGREDQRELRRGHEMLRHDLDAAIGNIRDHAIARQRARAELNLRKAPASPPLEFTPVRCCQHVFHLPLRFTVTRLDLQRIRWDMPKVIARN